MMFKAVTIALMAALTACVGLSGALWWKSGTIDRLRDEQALLQFSLAGCEARAANQAEDDKSDAQVDAMPDLTVVPDGWLLPPEPGAGGIY